MQQDYIFTLCSQRMIPFRAKLSSILFTMFFVAAPGIAFASLSVTPNPLPIGTLGTISFTPNVGSEDYWFSYGQDGLLSNTTDGCFGGGHDNGSADTFTLTGACAGNVGDTYTIIGANFASVNNSGFCDIGGGGGDLATCISHGLVLESATFTVGAAGPPPAGVIDEQLATSTNISPVDLHNYTVSSANNIIPNCFVPTSPTNLGSLQFYFGDNTGGQTYQIELEVSANTSCSDVVDNEFVGSIAPSVDGTYQTFDLTGNTFGTISPGESFSLSIEGTYNYPNSTLGNSSSFPYFILSSPTAAVTTTQITTVTPGDTSTIATSSAATFGATGFVAASDFTSGMFVQIKYAPYVAAFESNGASPALSFTTVDFPISASGDFDFSTTSPALTVGKYTMQTSIQSASVANNFLNLVGFGQFATFGINTSTSTTFIAAELNGYDIYNASTTASVDAYLASSTISAASCTSFTGFNLQDCFNLLLIPQAAQVETVMSSFKDGFLSYAPWGYVTRFITILSDNGTSTIPAISIETPLGRPGSPEYTDGSFTFDPGDMLAGGDALLNTVTAPYGGGGNFQQVMEPFVQLAIGLSVLMAIVYDLLGMVGHKRMEKRGVLH
jgi:hypothetical protein